MKAIQGQNWQQSLRATIFFMVVCGLLYPLAVTGLSQILFPFQAGGSLVRDRGGHTVGSAIIAQGFGNPRYFHPRPSAALSPDGSGPQPYDGAFSSPSNLGPDNQAYIKAVTEAARVYREENQLAALTQVPVDAATASGSGLDPDISLANAILQATRVAKARQLNPESVLRLIEKTRVGPQFGFLGPPRVNVLELNLALDALTPGR